MYVHCLYHALMLLVPPGMRQQIPNVAALRGYIADHIEPNLDRPIVSGGGFDANPDANVRSYLKEQPQEDEITTEE